MSEQEPSSVGAGLWGEDKKTDAFFKAEKPGEVWETILTAGVKFHTEM